MKIQDKYLKAAVLGSSDGIITTFAVVAGVVGAGLPSEVIIILGVASMVADGISMAVGDFLGERSIERMHKRKASKIGKTSIITFLAFIIAGTLPLLPYVVMLSGINFEVDQFSLSIIATAVALFLVGSLRTFVTKGKWWINGLEMLLVGSIAAIVAYSIGSFLESLL